MTGASEGEQRVGDPARRSRRRNAVWLIVLWLAVAGFFGNTWWRSSYILGVGQNAQIAEAVAWWHGRWNLEVEEPLWDTALVDGKRYSHFPPAFSIIAALMLPVFGGVPSLLISTLALLVAPWLAYSLFRMRTGSRPGGAVLAVGLVMGTSLWPVMHKAIPHGVPYFVNHVLGMIGVLLMLREFFGRRRVGVACVGLLLGASARQLSLLYVIPLLYMALAAHAGRATADKSEGTRRDGEGSGLRRGTRVGIVLATVALIVGGDMVLNHYKFGGVFRSGYDAIYAGRSDEQARDAHEYGVFSLHFVPRNAYYTNVGLPEWRVAEGASTASLSHNAYGTGIWWTTPLLLWVIADIRSIWRRLDERVWLIAAGLVFGVLLTFHGTGFEQYGYNRYSLDYVPVLCALAAGRCWVGRRRIVTGLMVAWSVLYFVWAVG